MSVIRPRLRDAEEIRRHPALGAFAALGVTLLNLVFEPYLGHTPALFVYLAALILTGPLLDRAGVWLQAGLSVLAWDFFFTDPRFSFTIRGREDVALVALYLLTTVAVARLARLARRREIAARRDGERLHAIHDIVRDIASDKERRAAIDAALGRLGDTYDATATFFVFERRSRLAAPLVYGDTPGPQDVDEARRLAEERLPLNRFVDIPDRGTTQNFVLPYEKGAAVLRLRFRSAQPDDEDRTETLRLVTHLLLLAPETP